jgi:SAM-dependent methyltransferase
MGITLSHDEARRVYDRIGRLQDTQAFYEDRATRELLEHGRFDVAVAVFEFGCGTGRFAKRMLDEVLPPSGSYRGVDVSTRMVSIARARLGEYGPRAEVVVTDGGAPSKEATGICDRFVSTYVLGLLSDEDIRDVLRDAHRMLRPDGLACFADLSTGSGHVSRTVARVWARVQARRPSLVGGCRPIELGEFLIASDWQVEYQASVVACGIPSEALVVRRR